MKSEENLHMNGRKVVISHTPKSVAVMKGYTTGIKGGALGVRKDKRWFSFAAKSRSYRGKGNQ